MKARDTIQHVTIGCPTTPYRWILAGFALWITALIGCDPSPAGDSPIPPTPDVSVISPPFLSTETQYYTDIANSIEQQPFAVYIDPGDTPIDTLYFVYTNGINRNNTLLQNGAYVPVPTVSPVSSLYPDTASHGDGSTDNSAAATVSQSSNDNDLELYYGAPDIDAFNQQLSPSYGLPSSSDFQLQRSQSVSGTSEESTTITAGTTKHNFFAYNNETVTATARYHDTHDGITLTIWVDDDEWCGNVAPDGISCADPITSRDSITAPQATDFGSRYPAVTQGMIDVLADRFLKDGEDNDIYNRAVELIGAPWGAHQCNNCISESKKNDIDILLYDISNDRRLRRTIAGYFYGLDIYANTNGSNERLIFYLDSILYAFADDDQIWNIEQDRRAQFMLSAMTHELQHMILNYQRRILRNVHTNTWLNEMLSMMLEDVIAHSTNLPGPRAILGAAATSSEDEPNAGGRLSRYICYNDESLVIWSGSISADEDVDLGREDLRNDYSMGYAFGAYLLRNYGAGAPANNIIKAIYQSDFADERAVVEATGAADFDTLLRNFAVAGLLSDQPNISDTAPIYYNNGGWFPAEAQNSDIYKAGSINLFGYTFDKCVKQDDGIQNGPFALTVPQQTNNDQRYRLLPTSHIYLIAAKDLTSPLSVQFDTIPEGVSLSIVAKRQ